MFKGVRIMRSKYIWSTQKQFPMYIGLSGMASVDEMQFCCFPYAIEAYVALNDIAAPLTRV